MRNENIAFDICFQLSEAYQEYLDDYVSEQRSQATDRQCWQSLLEDHTGGVRLDTRPKLWPGTATRMVCRDATFSAFSFF